LLLSCGGAYRDLISHVVFPVNIAVDYARLLGFRDVTDTSGEDGIAVVRSPISSQKAYQALQVNVNHRYLIDHTFGELKERTEKVAIFKVLDAQLVRPIVCSVEGRDLEVHGTLMKAGKRAEAINLGCSPPLFELSPDEAVFSVLDLERRIRTSRLTLRSLRWIADSPMELPW